MLMLSDLPLVGFACRYDPYPLATQCIDYNENAILNPSKHPVTALAILVPPVDLRHSARIKERLDSVSEIETSGMKTVIAFPLVPLKLHVESIGH
jgi:hypothetical protein